VILMGAPPAAEIYQSPPPTPPTGHNTHRVYKAEYVRLEATVHISAWRLYTLLSLQCILPSNVYRQVSHNTPELTRLIAA
jgi:hypothetical protein